MMRSASFSANRLRERFPMENDDAEEQRQLYLADDPTDETRFGRGTFGHHEALDRVHCQTNAWETFVVEHPSVLRDAELFQMAWGIGERMNEFYQAIGTKDLDDGAAE